MGVSATLRTFKLNNDNPSSRFNSSMCSDQAFEKIYHTN